MKFYVHGRHNEENLCSLTALGMTWLAIHESALQTVFMKHAPAIIDLITTEIRRVKK
jgi:hypothetical protein